MYQIYSIRNTVNNKLYIGQTSTSIQQRYNSHASSARRGDITVLYNAIRKYGIESFVVEHIQDALDREEANLLEMFWIAKLNTTTPNGYNMTYGGDGFCGTEEALVKLRGRILTPEQRAHISKRTREAMQRPEVRHKMKASAKRQGVNRRGIPRSQETIDKIKKAKQNISQETRDRLSASLTGRSVSDKTRKKISETNKGKKITSTQRQKLSDAITKKWQDPTFRQMMIEARQRGRHP